MSIKNKVVNKDLHILKIDRPLSGRCADELEQKFADARSFGVKIIVVDFENVAFVDSRGLAALVAGYKMFGSSKQNFKLAALQDQPKLLFELTMFDRIFHISDSITDAVGVVSQQQKRVPYPIPAFVSQPA